MANLYHNEYWECPAVARMQARRCLRHWSVPSSVTLCSTPNHALIRFCLKSSTSWAFSGRLAVPYFAAIAPFINSWLNILQHLFRTCFRWSTSSIFWRYTILWNKCIEVGAVQWTEIWKFIQVSYIIALLDWEQRIMDRMSGQTQLAERITTSRIY